MNNIRQIQSLNKRELENAVPPEASWHADYRDTAYIYVGGLPFDLSEGDIVTIFSQYGEPVHVNLVRDKETGKSRGFAFLKYEDQRSCDLAVDNLGGATVLGRMLRVDHTRYKKKDDEEDQDNVAQLMGETANDEHGGRRRRVASEEEQRRPLLKEEVELEKLLRDHDAEDPMKEFLVQEKKEEVALALERMARSAKKSSRRRVGIIVPGMATIGLAPGKEGIVTAGQRRGRGGLTETNRRLGKKGLSGIGRGRDHTPQNHVDIGIDVIIVDEPRL
ncbi:U2 snRNP component IST3 [Aspergillus sp. HF37]|nr:U2 snRNP component IST3 [Aspergillus sp. HF37]